MRTPIEDDVYWSQKLRHILEDQNAVDAMDDGTVVDAVDVCVHRLQRLRMGGRSTPLFALAVLLWRSHERWPRMPFDVEGHLALGFRVALDPTFVQPEWGVVLIGVLMARYERRLATEPGVMVAVRKQCLANLSFLSRSPAAGTAVRNAARGLLEMLERSPTPPESLDPLKRACLESWPDTTPMRNLPVEELRKIVEKMNEKLPIDLTEDERRYYRLHLEREGIWRVLEDVSLR